MSRRGQSPKEIEDEAARWVVRLHSDQVTSEDERAFTVWLAERREHRLIYDRQTALWGAVGSLRDDPRALGELSALRWRASGEQGLSRRRLMAASIAGVGVVGGGWAAWRLVLDGERYETAIGEQRRVMLADGSAVTLNTDTALHIQFDDAERRLWLERGQAFFAVARDASRPFRVFVGDDEVRAIGTAFDVRRDGVRACVTLEEGVVAVYRSATTEILRVAPPMTPAAVLEPGQQVIVAPTEQIQIAAVDVRRTGAWRFGQMVFEADALSVAIEEINRYNARQIVLADASLNDVAINGVFQTGRPEAFVEALTAAFPVEVRAEDDRTIVLARRAAP